jgi:IS5 family transposase
MEKQKQQPTFLDGLTADLGGRKSQAFFAKCDRYIPWAQLAASLADLFDDSDPARGGRPHYTVVTMLKCLLVQKWFHLSDPGLEETLRDRLSFRRFVGLGLSDDTPDETTVVKFRQRLRQAGKMEDLFQTSLTYLSQAGLVLQEGTLVDATILETSRGHINKEDGASTRDPSASFTAKGNQKFFGYKGHVAADKNAMVKDYVFDTAAPHDSVHADQLMEKETKEVYADSAYRSQEREERLRNRQVQSGILHKRVRGQAELTAKQKEENRLWAGIRAPVEHVFGWMAQMGYVRVRYRGLTRNALDFGLMVLAYNFKRAFSLIAKGVGTILAPAA